MSKWLETELKKIGNVVSGGTPSTSNSDYWNGDILFVTPYDLSSNETPYLYNTERKITKKGLENSSATILPEGSIVISSRAPIGYIAIGANEFTTNQGCKSVIPNPNFESLFLYYCFNFYVERMKKLGAGSTFAEISKKDLESVKFPHPEDKKEQRKISQILSTADTVIEKTQAAIAKYKAIKQGMLHDLFTRGIDINTGKLRPKYDDAPELYKESKLGWVPKEWDVERLEELTKQIVDGTHFTPKYTEHGIPFLRVTDVQVESIDLTSTKYISIEEHQELIKRCKPEKGDILYSKNGTIGIPKLVNWDWEFSVFVSLCLIKPNKVKILSEYLTVFLQHDLIRKQIEIRAKQGTVTNLHLEEIREFLILKPDLKEQQAILQYSTSILGKIKTEEAYLLKLFRIKQGLMSDLLSGKKEVLIKEKGEVLNG